MLSPQSYSQTKICFDAERAESRLAISTAGRCEGLGKYRLLQDFLNSSKTAADIETSLTVIQHGLDVF